MVLEPRNMLLIIYLHVVCEGNRSGASAQVMTGYAVRVAALTLYCAQGTRVTATPPSSVRDMLDSRSKQLADPLAVGGQSARKHDVLFLDRPPRRSIEAAGRCARGGDPCALGREAFDREAARREGGEDLAVRKEGRSAEEVLALEDHAPRLRRVGRSKRGRQTSVAVKRSKNG